MKMKWLPTIAGAGASLLLASQAAASMLTFNGAGYPLNHDYGDRIAGANQNGIQYSYGSNVAGWTPNVSVDYIGSDIRTASWGYGNLSHSMWNATEGEDFGVRFVADDGFDVRLHNFEIALYGNQDITIDNISFLDGAGNSLGALSNVFVAAGHTRTTIDLAALMGNLVSASVINVIFEVSGLGARSDNVSVDNFTFDQAAWQVAWEEEILENPIPGAIPLFLSGMFAIGWLKRRRAQKA